MSCANTPYELLIRIHNSRVFIISRTNMQIALFFEKENRVSLH